MALCSFFLTFVKMIKHSAASFIAVRLFHIFNFTISEKEITGI